MTIYSDAASEVIDLLTEFGQTITLRRPGANVYNAATGTNTPGAPTDQARFAAVFPFGSGQTRFQSELIQGSDKKVVMDANGLSPTINDLLIIAGVQYAIVAVKETNPAGTPVAFTLQVRR